MRSRFLDYDYDVIVIECIAACGSESRIDLLVCSRQL